MTENIVKKAITKYSYNEIFAVLRKGVDNDMYLFELTDGEKAVLRVSLSDVRESIDYEIKLLQHLSEKGAKVPEVIPDTDGRLWLEAEGHIAVVFRFIPGKSFEIEANEKPDPKYAFFAGKALGELHQAGLDFDYSNKKRRTIYTTFEEAVEKKVEISKLEGGEQFVKETKEYLKWAKGYKGPEGIIHNDFIPSNIMFLGGKVTGIVDFDWSCRAPLIKDLGIALATWSLPDGLEKHWGDIFDSFLEGYNSSAPYQIKKDKNLYHWISYACMTDACNFLAHLEDRQAKIKSTAQCRRYMKAKYFERLK